MGNKGNYLEQKWIDNSGREVMIAQNLSSGEMIACYQVNEKRWRRIPDLKSYKFGEERLLRKELDKRYKRKK